MDEPYELKMKPPRIAVLTGNLTCSAGEAVCIAFRGVANTKSFGDETSGKSTGNAPFKLPDGKSFALAISVMADRNQVSYGNKIQPDVFVENTPKPPFDDDYELEKDPVFEHVMNWLTDEQGKAHIAKPPTIARHGP